MVLPAVVPQQVFLPDVFTYQLIPSRHLSDLFTRTCFLWTMASLFSLSKGHSFHLSGEICTCFVEPGSWSTIQFFFPHWAQKARNHTHPKSCKTFPAMRFFRTELTHWLSKRVTKCFLKLKLVASTFRQKPRAWPPIKQQWQRKHPFNKHSLISLGGIYIGSTLSLKNARLVSIKICTLTDLASP